MIYRVIILLLLCSDIYAHVFYTAPSHGIDYAVVILISIYSITNNTEGLTKLNFIERALKFKAPFVSFEHSTPTFYLGIPKPSKDFVGITIPRYGLLYVSSILIIPLLTICLLTRSNRVADYSSFYSLQAGASSQIVGSYAI